MTLEEKLDLIKQVGEEIVTEAELLKLLESEEPLIAYDGFEPSGRIHIAQGLLRAININKMAKAGVKFKMWVADWHALANNKLGGDLQKIQTTGKYFIEVWKACGLDTQNVEFVWASQAVKNSDYWKLVIQVGRTNALRRFIRTAEMMGRSESLDSLTGANIIYSCMQVADIFTLGAQITQLGMDQRKVNMLAREIGPQLGFWKPVVVSHHMLMGLNKPINNNVVVESKIRKTIALKMSKSIPESAIFMTDTEIEIDRKISKAYCPPAQTRDNPIMEYFKYIIFESQSLRNSEGKIEIRRPADYGDYLYFNRYEELEDSYSKNKIHPEDVKETLIGYLIDLLKPVQDHFRKNPEAKILKEEVESYSVTR